MACRVEAPVAGAGIAGGVTQSVRLGSGADVVRFTYHFAIEDGRGAWPLWSRWRRPGATSP